MPEALLAIPPLQISADHSSENENTGASTAGTSDRSSISHNSSPLMPYKNSRTQGKNKTRKSNAKRLSKKSTLSVSSQQKKSGAKSQIPRSLLLTPSSSSTSLTTHGSFRSSPLASVNRSITTKEQTITTVLQRQRTGIILAYRQRKSISQMDMKHFRRNMQFPVRDSSHGRNSLMDGNHFEPQNYSFSHNSASFDHGMGNYDSYAYDTAGREPRMAGMKIFAAIMLNAWRKRRDEVKRLMEEVLELKRGAIKAKNQLHVFNTLFRVEQKRNDELNYQLKHSLDDINVTKSSCESLTTSLISLKADNALLEQQMHIKDQEFDNLNTLLSQTKSDLFRHMTAQRELQAELSMEQRKVQTLENQKNDFIDEILELNTKSECDRKVVQMKIDELKSTQMQLRDMEQQVMYLTECREQELHTYKIKDEQMQKEVEMLENEVRHLKKCLEQSLGNRLKNCWQQSVTYPKITLQMLHWLAFYLLPATPPPQPHTFPFGVTWNKALSRLSNVKSSDRQ